MTLVALTCGWALPWLAGFALLLACGWPRPDPAANPPHGGRVALRLGYGFFVGALLLTLWMRALSLAGIAFGWVSIGGPFLLGAAGALVWMAKRGVLSWTETRSVLAGLRPTGLPRWRSLAWLLLLAWLALRFASLAAEIAWRPLYPWDAWSQWATKARVWYELRRIVPFVSADTWVAGVPGAYFDASPGAPATIPLLQVWSSVAMGAWDDSAMNLPWLLTLIALALAVYGALRDNAVSPLGALIGAWLVVSLPLLDVQVALAGYADLLLAAVYALAALSLYRWAIHRDWRDAGLAAVLALFCPLIKMSGFVWALTLIPGIVVALLPRRGLRFVALGFGIAVLALLALGHSRSGILGHHIDFAPAWGALAQSYFFFANWNLLFYAAAALVLVAARRLIAPALAPLTMIAAAGFAFLFVGFAYPNAFPWLAESMPINRVTLQFAPLLLCLCVLLWKELTSAPAGAPSAAAPAVSDA